MKNIRTSAFLAAACLAASAFAARGRNNVTCSGSFPQTLENNCAAKLTASDGTIIILK